MPSTRVIASVIAALLAANVAVLSARTTAEDPEATPTFLPTQTPTLGSPSDTPDPSPTARRPGGDDEPARPSDGIDLPDLPYLPPAEGRYRYATRTTVTDQSGSTDEGTGVDVYEFAAPTVVDRVVRQTVEVRPQGSREGEVVTNEWRKSGLYRLERHRTGDRARCTFDPPQLVVPFPLETGEAFDAGSDRCAELGPAPSESDGVTTRESHTVLRVETVPVGGEPVECYVIEETTRSTIEAAQGTSRSESRTLKWFSPEYRLFVRVEVHVEGEVTGEGGVVAGSYSSDSTRRLLSLTPR